MQTVLQSPDEIFAQLKKMLVELFEIQPEQITPQAHLYQDLDIDSIDAIDLMMHLKELTGRKIQPDTFKHVRTVQDVVDAVVKLMADDTARRP
jgi:acyl carrier protein